MVNVTYDACKSSYCFVILSVLTQLLFFAAESLIINDDQTGVAYIYNPGDIAWTLAGTAYVLRCFAVNPSTC